MFTISRFKKKSKYLIRNKRGFSSIAGAIFAALVIFSLASTVFVWTLSQNTRYNNAVTQKNQLLADQQNEILRATGACEVSGNTVLVRVRVENNGPLTSEILNLWVSDSNTGAFGNKSLNTNLAAGSQANFFDANSLAVVMEGSVSESDTFTSWFVTGRGNIVPIKPPDTNKVTMANVSAGIGSLSMDFKEFKYYNVTGSGPYSLSPSNGVSAYSVQHAQSHEIAFKVMLTNFDEKERDITLSSGSELFILYPSAGGNALADRWYIVNVLGGQIQNNYTPVTLHFNNPTPVYFSSSSRYIVDPSTSSLTPSQIPAIGAVNLALIGSIGGEPFGQNIPFVSIEMVS